MKNKKNLSKSYFNRVLPLLKSIEKEFGYEAIGLYFTLYENIQENGKIYPINKLNKLSRCLKIQKRKLLLFIELAVSITDKKGFSLISQNDKYFWLNDFTVLKNKKHLGRKKISIDKNFEIIDCPLVNLTAIQYERLINKFGKLFVSKALEILNNWLKSGSREALRKINKNNYWYFREDSWLVYQTKKTLKII